MRVLEQSAWDPVETPGIAPISTTFRVTVVAFHLGLSMLESPRGRQDSVHVGTVIWTKLGLRGRSNIIIIMLQPLALRACGVSTQCYL